MKPSLLKYIKESTNNSIQNLKEMRTIKMNNAVKMDDDSPNNLPFLFMCFGFISFLAGYHVKRITSK